MASTTPRARVPHVLTAIAAVMADIDQLDKEQTNVESPDRFRFRGIDQVMRALGPSLRTHKVWVRPVEVRDVVEVTYPSDRGQINKARVTIVWRWESLKDASFRDLEAIGEAADPGDKAISKAHSVSLRTAMLQCLMIPTGDPDPDASLHVRGAAARPPVAAAPTGEHDVDPRADLWARIGTLCQDHRLTPLEMAAEFAAYTDARGLGRLPIKAPVEAGVTRELLERFVAHKADGFAGAQPGGDEVSNFPGEKPRVIPAPPETPATEAAAVDTLTETLGASEATDDPSSAELDAAADAAADDDQ